ncbi:hypothetical protein [Salinicoccus kekensis]|uniref:Uncharacterized protein n=1 Tax=Salinicoccus kekensis TaxID=714307 RepID=A0A285UTN2_9STAP|nr:hypothetical protein [Salinicoccus kekensis]SOC43601.1 hypothetical protein SAMN05878391_2036 [Salinicoccus kekensis]
MISADNQVARKPNFNIEKLKERAVRLETTKDGKVILDKRNPNHREWYNG